MSSLKEKPSGEELSDETVSEASPDQIFENILARLTNEDKEHNEKWKKLFQPQPKSKFALVIMTLVHMNLITTQEHRELTILWNRNDSTVRAVFELYEEDKNRTELLDSLKRLAGREIELKF